MTDDGRMLFRYVLLRLDPGWRRLPGEERAMHKKSFAAALTDVPGVQIHPYSTVGLRGDADLLLWEVAEGDDGLRAAQVARNGTELGAWLTTTYSYVAMTRRSRYLKGHTHEGQEADLPPGPAGERYLFVYPMDKQRPWYRLPYDDRRRMMGEHFKIGHRYPEVRIHTGYSFGIDDQEFVVAFEGPSIGQFLDLVEDLRGSEASAYTARDVPIFTAVRMPLAQILDQLDGMSAAAAG